MKRYDNHGFDGMFEEEDGRYCEYEDVEATVKYRHRLLSICERQMNEVTRFKKRLPSRIDLSDLCDPLLEIWKELK